LRLERREIRAAFWWENLKERDNLQDLGIVRRIILKWILKKQARRVRTVDLAEIVTAEWEEAFVKMQVHIRVSENPGKVLTRRLNLT
jgi:hypothetical protein